MISDRGSALILVLWCLLVLSVIVLAGARLIDSGISSERLSARRFEAKQLALTGIAYACDTRIEKKDPLLNQAWDNQKKLRVTIASEGGRININSLLSKESYIHLRDLFQLWGLSESDSATLTDCLRDWVDSDDLRSLHGAERRDLQDTSFSPPENRPFLAVAEMRAVKTWQLVEQANPNWAESFSILSAPKLDLQEAQADLLIVFGKLTRSQAESFIHYRNGLDQKPNTDDDIQLTSVDIGSVVGLSDIQKAAISSHFQIGESPTRITSTGIAGDTEYTITVIAFARGKELLWWEEK